MRKLMLALVMTVPLAFASAQSATDISATLAKAGFQLPKSRIDSTDFQLPGLDGGAVKLSSLRGSVVLLNFWATWCPPCRAEIPSLESFYGKLKAKGLRVLAVDVAEDTAKVADFVKSNKMDVTVLLDATGEIGQTYGAQAIPVTYIVAKDGSILGRAVGGRDWDTPETLALFETLLKAN